MRIVPFVRRETGDYKQHEAHTQVGGDHVYPHLRCSRDKRIRNLYIHMGVLILTCFTAQSELQNMAQFNDIHYSILRCTSLFYHVA